MLRLRFGEGLWACLGGETREGALGEIYGVGDADEEQPGALHVWKRQ